MNYADLLNLMDNDDDYLAFQIGDSLLNREPLPRGGSTIGRRTINRGRLAGHRQLVADYFAKDPTYPDALFRRRFRMR